MSDNQDQTPQWVFTAREDIEKAEQGLSDIQSSGRADIVRGLETEKAAQKLHQELSQFRQVLDQRISPSAWNDEIIDIAGRQLSASLGLIRNDIQLLASQYGELDQQEQGMHMYLNDAVNVTAITSGSAGYMIAQIERRFQTIAPQYGSIFEVTSPEQIGSHQKTYNELEETLNRIDPKYLPMLIGSEAALHSSAVDHLSQAAHSMRDLFQKMIEDLAPTDDVKRQPWFAPTDGAPGKVSRMSRLRYILYGSGEMLDKHEIGRLDQVAEEAKTSLDLAMARAHDHDPDLTERDVELAIDHARFWLLEVLKRYVMRHNRGAT